MYKVFLFLFVFLITFIDSNAQLSYIKPAMESFIIINDFGQVDFEWSWSGADPDYFILQVSTDNFENHLLMNLQSIHGTARQSGATSFQPNTQYCWRMAYRINNVTSAWSVTWCFTTASADNVPKSANETISIFPNPASDIISICSNDAELFDLKIYNTIGLVVINKINQNNMPVDIESLRAGVYTIILMRQQNIVYRQIFLKN